VRANASTIGWNVCVADAKNKNRWVAITTDGRSCKQPSWVVVAAVYLYDISVHTGQFEVMKESVASITADRRLQVLLVAFCFGALIEGAAGFGAPVAIAGAFMIGLGFEPFYAAALNLIANTAPVAR